MTPPPDLGTAGDGPQAACAALHVSLKRFCVPICVAIGAVGLGFREARAQAVNNGGFEQDLTGWEVRGAVAASSGIAVVTDENASVSLLFQPVSAPIGLSTVHFDFRNALSSAVPQGTVPDSFFATLYFTNNLATLDISGGVYDRAVALFDLDARGPFNLNGSIGASGKGTEWAFFTLTLQNTHGFIVPAFELRDLNLVNDDSAVAVDNVFLVPEPGVLPLAGAALLFAISRRRRSANPRSTL